MKKFKIIFVCCENITRSMSAEYCLKKYLEENGIDDIESSSAGTVGTEYDTSNHCFAHFDELQKMGVDVSHHKRKPLTQEMIDGADLIVAMSVEIKEWIQETFNIEAPLFSEITEGKAKYIVVPRLNDPQCDPVIRKMVKDFYAAMPKVVEYIYNLRQEI